jgi:peroxiredoxin
MKQLTLFLMSLAIAAGAPPAVGERAPGFTLMNLDGAPRTLQGAIDQGPVVLVVLRGFPGYQCPLCNRQVMELVKNGPAFAAAGVRVVMVYPGPKDIAQPKAQEFVLDKNLPKHFELLVDPDYVMTNLYNLRWDAPKETAYPSTFILNTKGVITFAKVSNSHGGRASAAEILAALGR